MKAMELEKAIAEFVGAFEIVFRYDWQYTKEMIAGEEPGETFIEPDLEDKTADWGERSALLKKYHQLIVVMQKNNLEPRFPFPLEALPDFKERIW